MESVEESDKAVARAVVDDLINSVVNELIISGECQIDKSPDAGVNDINFSENQSSNIIVQSEEIKKYRNDSDSWSDDDEDDSSSSSDTSSDSDFCQILIQSSAPKKIQNVKTKGELGLEDLPPIEDLVISLKEEEAIKIGQIHAVVDKLVVIRAIKGMKALDLDSVLFLSHEKPLGRVFDIFGPVVEPFYCVRFNNTDDINNKGVEVGLDVFFAPEKSDITTYVFVDELQQQKGSDASWEHNNEPPEEFLDFSDDEEEKAARRKRMMKNRNRQFSNSSEVAAKRIAGVSSPQSNFRSSIHSTPQRNSRIQSNPLLRHNPFSMPPLPPPSPTPSICSVMSVPIRVRNTFNHFSTPKQPRVSPVTSRPLLLQRSSPLLLTSYHQPPPVFSQVGLLSPMPPQPLPFHSSPVSSSSNPTFIPTSHTPNVMTSQNYFNQNFQRNSSPLPQMTPGENPRMLLNHNFSVPPPQPLFHSSPITSSIPTLIPVSHVSTVTPQNYFNQRFSGNPSPLPPMAVGNSHMFLDQSFPRNTPPASQNQHTLSSHYWSPNIPPNHPLTVQIPNQNNQLVSPNAFQPNSIPVQPFVNSNVRLPFASIQNRFL